MVAEGRGEGGGGFGIVRIRRANGSKPVTGRGLMRGGTTDLKIFLRHIPLSKKLTVRKALLGSAMSRKRRGEDRCFPSSLPAFHPTPYPIPICAISRPLLGPGFRLVSTTVTLRFPPAEERNPPPRSSSDPAGCFLSLFVSVSVRTCARRRGEGSV